MELLIILALILVNGLFSMSEISVVSSRKSKLDAQAKKGNKTARQILNVAENPDNFLSTVQIAITAVGLITGMYSGESLREPLGNFIERFGIDPYSAEAIARVVIILVITYVTLVLGELFPKKLGMNSPEKISGIIIKPMNLLTKLFYPFVWLLSVSTQALTSIFGIKKHNNTVTEEEIKSMINDSTEDGEIQEVEQDIVDRVFSLGDRDISSLMTHRTEFEWLDVDDVLSSIKEKLARKIHYIYPVADKTLDKIVGVVYLKDLFKNTDNNKTIKDIMRQPQYLHESVSVYDALETFKENKIHYALIIDEFGMVEGMVTMNDILESLVGNSSEFETEDDEDEFMERADGTFLIGGQYSFYDFLSHFDMEDVYQDNNYNTISGLLFSKIGVIPKEGEKIEWDKFVFEIVDMDSTRIDKVLVSIKSNENQSVQEE
ncbi:MAG: hemolysin family protein [Candidatus Onthomorpha sp.]|nr:hemolysin family protein [Bacteroidales bacterium]MDY3976905.1 hemolysin family protein [Candidatus Onthomorpha sp.]MCI6901712.1 hemolysin family protein [Bacteroidales bacterium]MCI7033970.1 hemolysin family protein [Bacteroidales bacterium]MCI7464808.1 hemolysin family protein [Bacteroidales bacterium]